MEKYKFKSYLVVLFFAFFSLINIVKAEHGPDFYWNIRNSTSEEFRFKVSTYRRYQLNNKKVTPDTDDGTLSTTLIGGQTSDFPARGVSTTTVAWFNVTDLEINYWEGLMCSAIDGKCFEFKKYKCDYGTDDSTGGSSVTDRATVVVEKYGNEYYVHVEKPHTGHCPAEKLKIYTGKK